MIKYKDKGTSVKRLQEDLLKLGYYLGNSKADGVFGKNTLNTILGFQSAFDLKVDGLVGEKTKKKLYDISAIRGTQTWFRMNTKHFTQKEFNCHCCGANCGIGLDLLLRLEALRYMLGENSIRILSGYRCKKHNQEVGGGTESFHLKGKASDIMLAKNNDVSKIYAKSLIVFWNSGIGEYKENGFVHVDTRNYIARW